MEYGIAGNRAGENMNVSGIATGDPCIKNRRTAAYDDMATGSAATTVMAFLTTTFQPRRQG